MISTTEAANRLGVTSQTIRTYIKQGTRGVRLKATLIGPRTYRIAEEDFAAFLRQLKEGEA